MTEQAEQDLLAASVDGHGEAELKRQSQSVRQRVKGQLTTLRSSQFHESAYVFDAMVTVRESAKSDHLLMEGMIAQTLHQHADLPGVEVVRGWGLGPLTDPERFGAVRLAHRGAKTVVFEHQGVLYFYSMGSATRVSAAGADRHENAFVSALCATIEQFRPRTVRTGPFSRLVRSVQLSGPLYEAVQRYSRHVHCAEMQLDLHGEIGSWMWQTLAGFAAMERDSIVRRTTLGLVASYERGEVPLRSDLLPFGYWRDEHGVVRPDPSKREQVAALLHAAADPQRTSREVAELAGEHGVTSPLLESRHGPGATLADADHPIDQTRKILGWLEVYETGRWVVWRSNPMRGVEEIRGIPIEREAPGDEGRMRLSYDFGLPEGGWVDPAVFPRIRAAQQARSQRGGSLDGGGAHQRHKPLVNLAVWQDDTHDHKLFSDGRGMYRLRRRPLTSAWDRNGNRRGWREIDQEGETVAQVHAAALHRSLVEGIITACREGVALTQPGQRRLARSPDGSLQVAIDDRDGERDRLTQQLANITQRLDNATRNATNAGSERLRSIYESHARELSDEATVVEQQLERLDHDEPAEPTDTPAPAEPLRIDADYVARALGWLATVDSSASRDLSMALNTVLDDLRLYRHHDQLHWQVSLWLPSEHGAVCAGPITGTVPVRHQQRVSTIPHSAQQRADRMIQAVLAGDELEAVLRAEGLSSLSRGATKVRQGLLDRGVPAAALAPLTRCPLPIVRQTLGAHLAGQPTPDHLDPAWVDWLIATYTDPTIQPGRTQWTLQDRLAAPALHILHQHTSPTNPWITIPDLTRHLRHANLDTTKTLSLLRHGYPTSRAPRGNLCASPPLARTHTTHNQVSLIDCPHCHQPLTHLIRALEVPTALLCTHCNKIPQTDSPTFPTDYHQQPYNLAPPANPTTNQHARTRGH